MIYGRGADYLHRSGDVWNMMYIHRHYKDTTCHTGYIQPYIDITYSSFPQKTVSNTEVSHTNTFYSLLDLSKTLHFKSVKDIKDPL